MSENEARIFPGHERQLNLSGNCLLFVHIVPRISGAEIVTLQLIESLDKTAWRPCFCLPAAGPFGAELARLGVTLYDYPFQFQTFDINPLTWVRYLWRIGRATLRLRRLVKQTGARLIYCASFSATHYAALAACLTGVPIIFHAHDIFKVRRINRSMFALVRRSFRRVIAISGAVRDNLTALGLPPDLVQIVPNGTDTARFVNLTPADGEAIRREWAMPDDAPLIGILGQLARRKGHLLFLEAARKIAADDPEARFVIVAANIVDDPLYEAEVRRAADHEALRGRVHFCGPYPWSRIPAIMAALDIVVNATLAEPFGLTLIEAMAAGKPVVAARAGGPPEFIADGEDGCLFTPGDAGDLARCLTHLLADPDRARVMGRNGREKARRHYDREANFKRIETIMRESLP